MEEIVDYLSTVWDLLFTREVLLIAVTAVLTHCLEMRKANRTRHTNYKDAIGEKVAAALMAVREVVLETEIIGLYKYSVDHSKAENINAVNKIVKYPLFMSDKEKLLQLCTKVSDTRGKHEPYLDLLSAAYLYVFERYLLNLALYINKNGSQDELPTLGLIIIVDVQRWAKEFDEHLVKQINCPHYKLFSQNGWLWRQTKRYVEKRHLLGTELGKLMEISSNMAEKQNDVNQSPESIETQGEGVHA